MNILAINEISRNLKDMSVEMPNAPYSNRYVALGTVKGHSLQS